MDKGESEMKEYHKIDSIYKRDPATNHKNFILGEWSIAEFGYLAENSWIWTEKIDGTNIRIMWDGEKVAFGGRTDQASIPTFLLSVLQEKFTAYLFSTLFPDCKSVCLYGEGYGAKIQKGGANYISTGTDFILFDVLVGDFYLKREDLEQIARDFSIKIVPIIGEGPISKAIQLCKNGFDSTISETPYEAEGLVLKPAIELFTRNGKRIITKIKCKDFK